MATIHGRSQLSNEAGSLTQANATLEVLHGQLKRTSLYGFGSDMLRGSPSDILATTVAHRLLKKFQKPIPGNDDALHKKCASDWLEFEDGLHRFSFDDVSLRSKSILYRAADLIRSWTIGYKPDYTKVDFTPGETFASNRGKTSMYQKLRTKACWTVTHDAFDDFARLVYNTKWLKKCAMNFFAPFTKSQHSRLAKRFKDAKHIGFAVFKHRFEHEVVTLVQGGRFESVPKDNTKRRPIIVAPLGNMLLQRCVAYPLRDILSRVGNDLERGQDVHRSRIRDSSVATIDFSNASDSNLLEVVNRMFPGAVSRYLCRYRDPMVLVDGVYHIPKKLSSMGCGFTFEVMTLLLLSIARVLDPEATVYGDDVIIKNDVAERFKEVMSELMWKVNEEKSFCNSLFRESCGAFYLDGCGYVVCFDFHWMECWNDVVITANKLLLICQGNLGMDTSAYYQAYEALLRLVPASLVGPVVETTSPDIGYVMTPSYRRIHMQSKESRTLWKQLAPKASTVAERLGWDVDQIVLVTVPQFHNVLATKTLRETHDKARVAYYLSSGKVSKDPIRNRGEWHYAVYVVSEGGRIPINHFREEEKRWEKVELRHVLLWYRIVSLLCVRVGVPLVKGV